MSGPGTRQGDSRYRLLRVYSYYRFALSVMLLGMYFVFRRGDTESEFHPLLYLAAALPYAIANLFALVFVLYRPREPRPRHLFLILVLDIAALILITHATGGINSGFAVLLIVTVAAAAIFIPGQVATLVAAVASLAVLAETVLLVTYGGVGTNSLFPAGLLGILLFASSLAVQRLTERLQTSQELALEKAGEVIELQRLNQLIVQRIPTGILLVDGADRVRITNQSAAQLLGVRQHEIADSGSALPRFIAERLRQWRQDATVPLKPFRIDEHSPLVQLSFAVIAGPSGQGTLIFADDFSEITAQAQQLKLASLGRLTASIAHEIRNPLGSISHAAQLLRESPAIPGDDRRLIDIVIANARRTNEVIENVLTLSRGHQPRPERIHLATWLARFVDELRIRDSDQSLKIDIAVDPDAAAIYVDPTHLRQILNNLCENGLRYSKRATGVGALRLAVSHDAEPDYLYLDVIDFGKGIEERNIASVFEPFFTTESSGTGLGLYLSRELCEANRISLEYRNDPGHGSCFRLRFHQP